MKPCCAPSLSIRSTAAAFALAAAVGLSVHGASPLAADEWKKDVDLGKINQRTGIAVFGGDDDEYAGSAVAGAGDVNGDGLADIVIGAEAAGRNGRGTAYVVYGRTDPIAKIKLARIDGELGYSILGDTAYASLGRSVAGAGDFNGDGYDDVIVGAPGAGAGKELRFSGEAVVVFGHPAGSPTNVRPGDLDGSNGFRFLGTVASQRVGTAVAGAGDVNGDGYPDVVVAAAGDDALAAYVVFGRPHPTAAEMTPEMLDGRNGFRIERPGYNDSTAVAVAGDINGDGFDDVVFGDTRTLDEKSFPGGAVYVVFGHSGKFPRDIDVAQLDGRNGFTMARSSIGWLGSAIASGEDFDDDGIDDLVLGGPETAFRGEAGAGGAIAVFGRKVFPPVLELRTLPPSERLTIYGTDYDGRLGTSVALVPDVNKDGIADILVGGPRMPNQDHFGEVYLVFSSGKNSGRFIDSSTNSRNATRISGAVRFDAAGTSVAGVGDFNGDGVGDLLIGAPGASPERRYGMGISYVMFGR